MPGIVLGSGACKSLTEGLRNVLRDHLREMGESGLMCWDGNNKAFSPLIGLQWILDKTAWKGMDVILMQKKALEGRSTWFIFE